MKLRRSYAKKEDVPEQVAGLYNESGGIYQLNPDIEVEGLVPNATLDEFRNTNIELRKSLERFDGVDPDKYRDLSTREQQIKDAEVKGADRIEQRVAERTKEAVAQMEKDRAKLTGERDAYRTQLQKSVIEAKSLELATPFGLRKDAARNLILLVNEQWTLDEGGQPVAFENDRKTIRLDGAGKPMRGTDGLQRFIEKLAKEDAKFLFEGNQGGGAQQTRGGSYGQDDGEVNPFDPKTYNRTKQAMLVKTDFAKAKRMASKFNIDLQPSSIRGQASVAS